MLCDTLEHVAQIGFRIDVVELGSADQRVDPGSTFPAGICTGKQVVLAPKRDASQRSLGSVVVQFGPPIISIATQGLPA
jgi:hypothetical protein